MEKRERSTHIGPLRRSIAAATLGSTGLASTAPALEVALPPVIAITTEAVLTVPLVANDLSTIIGHGVADLCESADPDRNVPTLAPFCE